MIRQGAWLIALAVVGFCAMMLYNHAMGAVWEPLNTPLPVNTAETTIGPFALKAGLKYDLSVYVDPADDVPYEDCLLGQTGDAGLFGNCKGHPPALDAVWAVRDDLGRMLRSVSTPREGACCGYVGSRVDETIAYDFSVPKDASAFLQIRYRRNAAALAPLHPYVEIFAHDAAESAGVGQFVIGALLLVVAGIGGIILLSFVASRYLPIRRAMPHVKLDRNRRKAVDELVAREKAQGELGWWWLSFVDPDRPEGHRSLGVAIVEGYGVVSASRRAHELGVNPGGEVRGEQLTGDAIPSAEYRNRLLSRSDLEDAGLIDKRTLSEKDHPELIAFARESLPCFDFESPPLDEDDMILTCRQVWVNGEPVRYVSHDDDGSFQFLCGGNEHTSAEEAVSVHARHLFERGPDQLRDFTYLRKGCFAEQSAGGKWNLGHLPSESV